jgi:serine/threonine protein phosphatase 1
MTRTYAIGDIHGHLDLLAGAHRLIAADRRATGDADAPVVHLGDLVDRGPESAEVIEFIAGGPVSGGPWITLLGNHDHLFRLFLQDPAIRDPGLRPEQAWLHPRIGGTETLRSYGLADPDRRAPADLAAEARARVPAAHRAFLAGLPLWHLRGEALFVHAGIRPGIAIDAQDPSDLLWIRGPFLDDPRDHGALVVHGHTPVARPTHFGNRLALDTGAAYGGPLTAAVIEGRRAWWLTPEGRLPLHPPGEAGA